MKEYLPQNFFSEDATELFNAVYQMGSANSVFSLLQYSFKSFFPEILKSFASVMGALVLSSVFSSLQSAFSSKEIGKGFSFCSVIFVFSVLISQGISSVFPLTQYFENLQQLTSAFLPLGTLLYSMGGNVGAAAASGAGLSIYLTLLESTVKTTLPLFCGICFTFALLSAFSPSAHFQLLLSSIKKNYTAFLGFLMMLLSAILSTQTILAAKSDTLAMKSAKFAVGNLIPVLGGSISDLLRSVSAQVGYLRGIFGTCGIWLVLFLLFPTILRMFFQRLAWSILAGFAEIAGCESEKKFLDELASICGFLIFGTLICSFVCILAFSLLLHTASAIGG